MDATINYVNTNNDNENDNISLVVESIESSENCLQSFNSLSFTKKIGIVYHYPCLDGAYAVLSAYSYYANFINTHQLIYLKNKSNEGFNEINLTLDKLIQLDKLLVFDKSLKDNDILLLKELIDYKTKNKLSIKILIIDHHMNGLKNMMSAFEKEVKEKIVKFVYFDGMSACNIAYEYYKEKVSKKKISCEYFFKSSYKELNEYIEDSDNYTNKLKYINEFKSGISELLSPSFATFNFKSDKTGTENINKLYDVSVRMCVSLGEKSFKSYKESCLKELSRSCFYCSLTIDNKSVAGFDDLKDNYRFLVCFSDKGKLRSLSGAILSQVSYYMNIDPIGGFIYQEDGKMKISLRSDSSQNDLSRIASYYGGGGHQKAASFTNTRDFFNKISDKTFNFKRFMQSCSNKIKY